MRKRLIAGAVIAIGIIILAAYAQRPKQSAVSGRSEDQKTAGSITERATALLNRGAVEEAEKTLREHLRQDMRDQPARVLLGQVLDFDGRPEEALSTWQAGIVGESSDSIYWTQIGNLHARQGSEGPTVTYRRGSVTTRPERDSQASKTFKQRHLSLAAEAFRKASAADPDNLAALGALAQMYFDVGDFDRAENTWRELRNKEPNDPRAVSGLAEALQALDRHVAAVEVLEAAIVASPRTARFHQLLAGSYEKQDRLENAEQSRQRASFFEALPQTTRLDYSPANRQTLANLRERETVERLCNDASAESTQFLAALCWSHPHNELEEMAFQALEKRCPEAIGVVRDVLKDAQSTCTIRSAAHILARQKDIWVFDRLVQMLPGDIRMVFPMEIADALDELGDRRAVGPLAEVLDPGNRVRSNADESPIHDRTVARGRAALALGAFDTSEARQALERGLSHPDLGAYCAASLYRLTHDAKHLKSLRSAVMGNDGRVAYLIARYLPKIHTSEADALLKEWQQREANQKSRG